MALGRDVAAKVINSQGEATVAKAWDRQPRLRPDTAVRIEFRGDLHITGGTSPRCECQHDSRSQRDRRA